jgi:putative ABC transport system substrate-binding protein
MAGTAQADRAKRDTRAVLRDRTISAGIGQFAVIQSVAPCVRIDVTPVNAQNVDDIERASTAFGQTANGGLIVTGGAAQLQCIAS